MKITVEINDEQREQMLLQIEHQRLTSRLREIEHAMSINPGQYPSAHLSIVQQIESAVGASAKGDRELVDPDYTDAMAGHAGAGKGGAK